MSSIVTPCDNLTKVNSNANVTSRDWIIAAVVALVAVALTMIPYALGYALARDGTEFTGVIMNPEDAQSYFAKMLEGFDGQWLYTIPFTSEDHAPAFVGGFYLLLGHLARVLNLSLTAMWHLSRVVADLILFLAAFGFIAAFLRDARARWTAYLLAIFGSGLGWLLFLLGQRNWLGAFPVDFKMPEAHLFFSALTFPHVALGTALILASLWLTMQALERKRWTYAVGAGAANLALGITYPFLIYLVAATLGIYWLYLAVSARRILWCEGFLFAIAFVIPAPLLLYYAAMLATNPVFRAWDAQAVTLSPPLPHYLLAYGVMLLLGLLVLLKRRDHSFAILWAWLAAAALLVYAPLNPQRRFVEGVQVPLAILATAGLFDVVLPWIEVTRAFKWLAARPRYSTAGLERFIVVVFLALMSLSNLYILASTTVTAAVQQPYPLFRSRDEIAAVEWLRANTARTDVVLGAYETGNYVAAHAGNRVVVGHWAETVDWEKKFSEVNRFYSLASNEERSAMLSRSRVRYVWWGTRERDLGNFDPSSAAFLEPAFSDSTTTIYRVR